MNPLRLQQHLEQVGAWCQAAEYPIFLERAFYDEKNRSNQLLEEHHELFLLPSCSDAVGPKFSRFVLIVSFPSVVMDTRCSQTWLLWKRWRSAPRAEQQSQTQICAEIPVAPPRAECYVGLAVPPHHERSFFQITSHYFL